MLIVDIKINDQKIYHLTALNIGAVKEKGKEKGGQWRLYVLPCGHKIRHNREDGALVLANMMINHGKKCQRRIKMTD